MILLLLKGIGIGLAVILPGMSGGTAALIFGVYGWIITNLRKLAVLHLLPMMIGISVGIVFGARVITRLLDAAPSMLFSFLIGLILASAALVLHDVGPLNWSKLFIGLLSLSTAWILAPLPAGGGLAPDGALFAMFTAGMISSGAMVLPGISGSSMMIIMGQYERMLEALVTWNWPLLGVFSAGALVGLLGFAQVIGRLLEHFRNYTLIALAGLMVGATRVLLPEGFGLWEMAAAAVGVVLAGLFRRREN